MRRYEHQARTARKRPERQTDAVPVRGYGTAVSQTNEVWSKIYIVVRESKLSKWDETNPNDDIMEKLLGGKA